MGTFGAYLKAQSNRDDEIGTLARHWISLDIPKMHSATTIERHLTLRGDLPKDGQVSEGQPDYRAALEHAVREYNETRGQVVAIEPIMALRQELGELRGMVAAGFAALAEVTGATMPWMIHSEAAPASEDSRETAGHAIVPGQTAREVAERNGWLRVVPDPSDWPAMAAAADWTAGAETEAG